MEESFKYEVGISFAEKDRNAALALALALELAGFKSVYYYPDQQPATVGLPLKEELEVIYSRECRYTVMLLSKHYFGGEFATIERHAILKRRAANPGIRIVIPVLLNRKLNLSGYPELNGLGYTEWDYKPKEIAQILRSCFGGENTKGNKTVYLLKQINVAGNVRDMINNATINF